MREAAFGNVAEARQSAAEALKLVPASQGVEAEAALAFAMAGDAARADSPGTRPGKRSPLDTLMHSLWLPAIQAQLALDKKEPDCRLECVASCFRHRVGTIPSSTIFVPLCDIRSRSGISGSRARHRSRRRVSEDYRPQRHRLELLDGSLGASGRGSCQCLAGENLAGSGCRSCPHRALAAYKDFLTLWKDADPDIPILKQAKAEYAKLQ